MPGDKAGTTDKPIYCPRRRQHSAVCETPNGCAGGADCRLGPDLDQAMNDWPAASRTTPNLATLIERARQITPRTPEQERAAMRAYALAEVEMGDDADELAWREAFRADDQATIDRLNAEGVARRQRADEIGKREGWW